MIEQESAFSPGNTARQRRLGRVRARMAELGVDALLLSLGADLPWLSGYEAMALERLTMMVLPVDDQATLVVPRLEAPRVALDPEVFVLRPWAEAEDPTAIVAALVGDRRSLGVSERTWAAALLDLQQALPAARWQAASKVTGSLRAIKDQHEIEALRLAAAAADRVAGALQAGEIRLVGRTEAEVSADIGRRLMAEGHSRVNFAIVGSGPNAASPHHEPGQRRIGSGEAVVCDFGGVLSVDGGPGYCSDITRTVVTERLPPSLSELYQVLQPAQAASVAAAVVGATCESVDQAARRPITDAGYGEFFIHRTGHGIGLEEHEAPYIMSGNRTPLAAGHTFSIEPGIYVDGSFGARLEDIVVATEQGPELLNRANHDLVVVEA